MAEYICKRYPQLGFFVGDQKWYFDGGIFDTENPSRVKGEYGDEVRLPTAEETPRLIKTLDDMVRRPTSLLGVMRIDLPVDPNDYECTEVVRSIIMNDFASKDLVCGVHFKTQAQLNGHKAVHQSDSKKAAKREESDVVFIPKLGKAIGVIPMSPADLE